MTVRSINSTSLQMHDLKRTQMAQINEHFSTYAFIRTILYSIIFDAIALSCLQARYYLPYSFYLFRICVVDLITHLTPNSYVDV